MSVGHALRAVCHMLSRGFVGLGQTWFGVCELGDGFVRGSPDLALRNDRLKDRAGDRPARMADIDMAPFDEQFE